MRRVAVVALLLALATAWPADAKPRAKRKQITLDAACADVGAPVTLTGRKLKRARVEVGGVAATVLGREGRTRTFLVPGGTPPGATTVAVIDRRGRRREAAFRVRGPEVCDAVDNDCNGIVDDGIADVVIGVSAGSGVPRVRSCRGGRFVAFDDDEATGEPAEGDACLPGVVVPCWEGPDEARGVGLCTDGVRTCGTDGTFGACLEQVLPGEEDPGNGYDEDCNGRDGPGGGELCVVGTIRSCYEGPPQTRGVGACRAGARMCNPPGLYGICEEQVLPATEVEGDGIDQDCDGADVVRGPALELVVDPPFSPTFQTSAVLTGSVGSRLAPPPAEQPKPIVASVSPASGRQGQTLQVTITGQNSHFQSGLTQAVFGPGVAVTALTVQSPTQATATLAIAADANVGPRVVAVGTGAEQALLANVFTVQAAVGGLAGRITDANGNAVPGAQVCVSGTAICTTADANGAFTLPEVATDATRLLITAPGFGDLSVPVGSIAGVQTALGAFMFAPVGDPPPPPDPGAPALSPQLASLVARLATIRSSPQLLDPERAKALVRDTVLQVGGVELGLLDADGVQLNPSMTGAGPVSLTPAGQDQLARALTQGELTTLEDFVFFLATAFQWSPPGPPAIDAVIAILQQAVDAAWTDPDAPESAAAIMLFNRGASFNALPPVLARQTQVDTLQAFLLLMGVVVRDFDREIVTGPRRPGVALASARADDVLGDVRLVPATHANPGDHPPSSRQLSRMFEPMQQYAVALIQAEEQINAKFISVQAIGGLNALEAVSEGIVGSATNTFQFFRLTAQLAPDPPEIVGVEQDLNTVKVRIKRTPHDTAAFTEGSGGRVGPFYYTLYRRSVARPNEVVVANLRAPAYAADSPPGVFTVVDPQPEPGLNEYYADVREKVALTIPEIIAERARFSTKVVPNLPNMFVADLLSDYSIPSPFPAPFQPEPTAEQIRRSQVHFAPFAAGFVGDAFGSVAGVAADAAGNQYVSDAVRQEIVKTATNGARSDAGFGVTPSGFAMDKAGNLYTCSADSEGQFGGRLFKYTQPNLERSFVGTIDKYSPLLDRGNPVSVGALAIGPPLPSSATPNAPLGDLYVGENYRRDIRRVPISIIPAEGIGALPAPGGGIFGAAAASPVVGHKYADVPGCLAGAIRDLAFDPTGQLHVLTQGGLLRIPYRRLGFSGPGLPLGVVKFPGAGGADTSPATVQINGAGGGTASVSMGRWRMAYATASGTPCEGTYHWSVDPVGLVRIEEVGRGLGASEVRLTGITIGTGTLTVDYVTPNGTATATAAVEVKREAIVNLVPERTTMPADGHARVPVEVEVHDQDGKPIAGEPVTISVNDLAKLVIPPSTQGQTLTANTNADGKLRFAVFSGATPGIATITATHEGKTVSQPLKLQQLAVKLPPGLTEVDLVRIDGETDMDVVIRLYKKAFPESPTRRRLANVNAEWVPYLPGQLNNAIAGLGRWVGAGSEESAFACGGCQAQTLQILDTLRVHPVASQYFQNVDYGPLQAFQTPRDATVSAIGSNPVAHYAAVIYPKGTNFQFTGTVLDPWINQKPDTYTMEFWNTLCVGTPLPSTSNYKDRYPITRENDVEGPDRYPTPGGIFGPPAPFKPLDPELDNETYRLQLFVSGPVRAIVTDTEGRRTGMTAADELLQEIPYAGFLGLPGADLDLSRRVMNFILLRRDVHLTIIGIGTGTASLVVADMDPMRGEGDFFRYADIPVVDGQEIGLDLGPGIMRQPLALPMGQEIVPETIPPPVPLEDLS